MKKNAISMALMMVSSFIFAQQKPARSAMAERQTEKMKTELSLSSEQVKKVDEINKKFASSQALLLADSVQSRESKLVERKRMQDERNSEIKGVLTTEQFLQWTMIKEKQKGSSRAKGKRVVSVKGEMDELKTELDLTDEQYKRIMAINSSMAGRMKAMRKDTTVSRMDFREEIKKIKVEKNEAIKSVLSKDQYEKFVLYETEKLNHRRRGGAEREKHKRG